jgi:hypothetical protein
MQVENKGKNKIVMEKELAKFREDLYIIFLPKALAPLWKELYKNKKKEIVTIEYENE